MDEKGVAEKIEITVDGFVVDGESVVLERAGDLVDGKKVADIVEDETREPLEDVQIADAVFGGDVLVENRVEDARKVIRLNRGALGQKGRHRESAESHVVLKRRIGRKIL